MADKNNEPADADDTDVGKILDQIEAVAGDENSVAKELAKSMGGAFSGLVDLLKAQMTKDDDDPDTDTDTEEEDDDEDADDDAPGFTDMNFSSDTPPTQNHDITEWLWQVGNAVRQLAAEKQDLKELQKAVQADIRSLESLLTQSTAHLTEVLIPLSKGVLDLHRSVEDLPEAVVSPTATRTRTAAARTNADTPPSALIGGTPRREKQALAKAMANGILDASQKRRFHLHRVFEDDPNLDQEVRGRVEALAA